jgi:hypothetical protein
VTAPPANRRQSTPAPALDAREAEAWVAELERRRPGYAPEWIPGERGAGAAIMQIAARYMQTVGQRLNRAPLKNQLAFLDRLGIRPTAAQSARAPMIFRLSDNVVDMRLPRGTRIAAPPPPGSQDQIIFETERSLGLAAARLAEVVSLWPGRDGWIDLSTAVAAEQPFHLFRRADLADTPHALYLAHDALFALTGESRVAVTFDLATPSSDWLDIRWEYWDGEVWRQFLDMRPQCAGDTTEKLDGTDGLRRSGTIYLETECAGAQQTAVNGITAFWVRGLLTETLPANPARILPEVERIRLATEILRPLGVSWAVERSLPEAVPAPEPPVVILAAVDGTTFEAVDEHGAPLPGIRIAGLKGGVEQNSQETGSNGSVSLTLAGSTEITAAVGDERFSAPFVVNNEELRRFILAVSGIELDKAAVDDAIVDVTKPFYPFGLLPHPGSVFAFSNVEVFARPGAVVRIYIQPAPTVPDQISTTSAVAANPTPSAHALAWEYWNGDRWAVLGARAVRNAPTEPPAVQRSPLDFTGAGFIEFTVPDDIAPATVADQTALWMRVRLLSGGYGYTETIAFNGGPSVSFFVPRPPAVAAFRFGYEWRDGPHYSDHVLAHNDFTYLDHTEAARWPGPLFRPYTPVSDATPALYLGFDKPLPVDDIGLWFDVAEQPGESEGPALRWEHWDGFTWEPLVVDDETRALRVPGVVRFIGPRDSRPLARFGTERHWIRARLAEDGPPGEPELLGLALNAVWASQQQTVLDEALGASTGQPNQSVAFRQLPVLPGSYGIGLPERPSDLADEADEPADWETEGQWIEIRELAGLRASVQWRMLAAELTAGRASAIPEIERRLAREGAQTEIRYGDLRLVRDRTKQVTEAWVRWRERPTLSGGAAKDRVFVVDRARGRLLFGDGTEGMAPPPGAAIQARRYRTGGGESGNLPRNAITQLLSPLGGIEGVWNALPAEGGADGETVEALLLRGPSTIRHRGRPLAARDYETLAREASSAVAVARAIGCRGPDGRFAPGWVTLVIIPRSAEARPYPTFGLRERVRAHIGAVAPADLAAVEQLRVVGPDYVAVDVDARIVPRATADAGAVETAARLALGAFLHPLRGGPEGLGWDPGRSVYLSDVAAVLERAPGVDYVTELSLAVNGARQAERAAVGPEQTVVAGVLRLQLVGGG